MEKITIEEAEQKLLDMLNKEDIGEVVYETTQDLFLDYVKEIEDEYKILNPDVLDRYEEWYDGVYQFFIQSAYDKMLKFLNGK